MRLEASLEIAINNLVNKMRSLDVSQYISAFSNRFEDILLNVACSRLGFLPRNLLMA